MSFFDRELFNKLAQEKHKNGLQTKYVLMALITDYKNQYYTPLKSVFIESLSCDPSVQDMEEIEEIQERLAFLSSNMSYFEFEVVKLRKLGTFNILDEEKCQAIFKDFLDLMENSHNDY